MSKKYDFEDPKKTNSQLLYLKAQMFDVMLASLPDLAKAMGNGNSMISTITKVQQNPINYCCDHFIKEKISYPDAIAMIKEIFIEKIEKTSMNNVHAAERMGVAYPTYMAWKYKNEKKTRKKGLKN